MKLSILIGLLALTASAEPFFGGKKHKEKEKEVKEVKLKKIPHCSLECLTNAMAKYGCGANDYACACTNFAGLKKKASGCVLSKCGIHTARRKVLPAVKALCEHQKQIEQKLEEQLELRKTLSMLQVPGWSTATAAPWATATPEEKKKEKEREEKERKEREKKEKEEKKKEEKEKKEREKKEKKAKEKEEKEKKEREKKEKKEKEKEIKEKEKMEKEEKKKEEEKEKKKAKEEKEKEKEDKKDKDGK